MPEVMAGHCRQLLEWRIKKVFSELPAPGAEVTILYSARVNNAPASHGAVPGASGYRETG